jgi:hypothetical protein
LNPAERPQGRIGAAGGVVMKCTQTVGRVVDARSVAKERVNTGGSVLVAIDVGLERIFANGRVEITIIDKERPITNGSVLEANGVGEQGERSIRSVFGARGCSKELLCQWPCFPVQWYWQ